MVQILNLDWSKFNSSDKVYVGSVVNIKPATNQGEQLWHILYEDEDEEDFDEEQMQDAVALYMTIDSDDYSSDSDVFDPLE